MKYYKSVISPELTIYFAMKDNVVWYYIDKWIKTAIPASTLNMPFGEPPEPLGRSIWCRKSDGKMYIFDNGIKFWDFNEWVVSNDITTFKTLKDTCFQVT